EAVIKGTNGLGTTPAQRHQVTSAQAKKILNAAEKKAENIGVPMNIAVVDSSSNLPGGSLYGIEETNGGLIAFGGGLPIRVHGILIGAVGVSGGSVEQDVTVATAGASAL
ncbi:unnamed protein product, partial [Didymodactylos carnosus]